MKTVQQIMQETGAEANIRNFRYMQENYTYKQKIRHAENVARSYQDKCSEMGLNCHISVGGLDSITLHYFLEACGVHVPCVSCSSLEQKGVQAVHKQIAAEMENTYSAREWLGAHMALPQDEIDTITDPRYQSAGTGPARCLPARTPHVFLETSETENQSHRRIGLARA